MFVSEQQQISAASIIHAQLPARQEFQQQHTKTHARWHKNKMRACTQTNTHSGSWNDPIRAIISAVSGLQLWSLVCLEQTQSRTSDWQMFMSSMKKSDNCVSTRSLWTSAWLQKLVNHSTFCRLYSPVSRMSRALVRRSLQSQWSVQFCADNLWLFLQTKGAAKEEE